MHSFRCKAGRTIANAFSEIVEVICIMKKKNIERKRAGRVHRALKSLARDQNGTKSKYPCREGNGQAGFLLVFSFIIILQSSGFFL